MEEGTNWWDGLPQADTTYVNGGFTCGELVVDGIRYSAGSVGAWSRHMVDIINDHRPNCPCMNSQEEA